MKDNSYYIVYGWMQNRLKLKGTALQLYAVIYGFSRDGESECSGSLAYLAETTGCTRQTVLNHLTKLEKQGYIQKRQSRDNDGGMRNHYKVNLAVVEQTESFPQDVENGCEKNVESKAEKPKNFTPGVKKLQSPCSKNQNAPSQKTRPNNTNKEYINHEECVTRTPEKRYGGYYNVRITEQEYQELKQKFGAEQFDITLNALSSFMADTGGYRFYKSHYHVLERWCREDSQKSKCRTVEKIEHVRDFDVEKYKIFINNF